MARHWEDWEHVSSTSRQEDIVAQVRDRVLGIIDGAVLVADGLVDPAYLE